MSTCNRMDLETLDFWPILPRNLHCRHCASVWNCQFVWRSLHKMHSSRSTMDVSSRAHMPCATEVDVTRSWGNLDKRFAKHNDTHESKFCVVAQWIIEGKSTVTGSLSIKHILVACTLCNLWKAHNLSDYLITSKTRCVISIIRSANRIGCTRFYFVQYDLCISWDLLEATYVCMGVFTNQAHNLYYSLGAQEDRNYVLK